MASISNNPSPEVKSILIRTHDLTTALSNEPLSVAGILLSKELICREIHSKMLIDSYTPAKKAAILVEAVTNTIEIAPLKFTELLVALSEHVCTNEVVEKLRSTHQSELNNYLPGGGGGLNVHKHLLLAIHKVQDFLAQLLEPWSMCYGDHVP